MPFQALTTLKQSIDEPVSFILQQAASVLQVSSTLQQQLLLFLVEDGDVLHVRLVLFVDEIFQQLREQFSLGILSSLPDQEVTFAFQPLLVV